MGSLGQKANPGLNLDTTDPGWEKRVAYLLNNILIGKTNNTGTVKLVHGGVSTTVSDARCGPDSHISLMPTSATGEAALIQWSVLTRTNGSFTIHHISTSTSNATASYAIIG